ncbi:unnamed protein product, partial [Amoebophrya sp. A120]
STKWGGKQNWQYQAMQVRQQTFKQVKPHAYRTSLAPRFYGNNSFTEQAIRNEQEIQGLANYATGAGTMQVSAG